MNFLELCQRLRQEVGAAGNGPAAVTSQSGEYARLVTWIRTAWQEIQNERRWAFDWVRGEVDLNTLDTTYPLPNDFDVWEADSLKFGTDKIEVVSWSELEPASTLSRVVIAPDGVLHLNSPPKADDILHFEYWRTPQDLVTASDVPRLPVRFHMVIVYRAMLQYALYENASEVAQQASLNEARLMNRMMESQLPAIDLPEPLA